LLALGLAAAWRWTDLSELAEPRVIGHWLRTFKAEPWAVPFVLALYLVSSVVMFPNTVLNVATVLTFHGPGGVALAIGGSMLAALAFYALGRRFGVKVFPSASTDRAGRLGSFRAMLQRGGVLGVFSVRLMPVAPFSVVNVVAGALRVKLYAFTVGSLLGLAPGPVLVSLFGREVRHALRHPGPASITRVVVTGVAALGASWLARRMMRANGPRVRTGAAPGANGA
jgi:uncharacterized membrane protein YdjX (TVP38/TMEM64 family)